MLTQEPKKQLNFYLKILFAVLVIGFLNIAYLLHRGMSGSISFYYFSITEKTICIFLSLLAMPIMYILIAAVTLLLKKTNRNLCLLFKVPSINTPKLRCNSSVGIRSSLEPVLYTNDFAILFSYFKYPNHISQIHHDIFIIPFKPYCYKIIGNAGPKFQFSLSFFIIFVNFFESFKN